MAERVFNDTKINVEFTPSSNRQSLVSGENLSTSLGKIAKIINDLQPAAFNEIPIYIGTTEYWNNQATLIGKRGAIYIYEDYSEKDNIKIPNIKIGDGKSYLMDNPFVTTSVEDLIDAHINDNIKHITAKERQSWNKKIRCYIDEEDNENIIFTTN